MNGNPEFFHRLKFFIKETRYAPLKTRGASHRRRYAAELSDAGMIETYGGEFLEGAADACEKLLKK